MRRRRVKKNFLLASQTDALANVAVLPFEPFVNLRHEQHRQFDDYVRPAEPSGEIVEELNGNERLSRSVILKIFDQIGSIRVEIRFIGRIIIVVAPSGGNDRETEI